MLKTMYQQFMQGETPLLVRDGTFPRNIGRNDRYYKYRTKDKSKGMAVFINTDKKFPASELPEYIASGLVTIRYIEFSEY